jgi:hypothetical protein
VKIAAVDTREVVGETPPGPAPHEVWWALGGRRLVTVTSESVRIHDARGRLLRSVALPSGWRAAGSAVAPGGRRLAIIVRRGSSSALLLLRLDRAASPRSLFSTRGAFEGLAWSIDGSLLVLGLPQQDQWLFVHARGGFEAVRHMRELFEGGREPRRGAFPRPAGWCYADPADRGTSGQRPCSSGSAPW